MTRPSPPLHQLQSRISSSSSMWMLLANWDQYQTRQHPASHPHPLLNQVVLPGDIVKIFQFIGFKTFKSVLNSPQPRSVVEMIATWRTALRDKPERRPWLGPRQWDDWDDVAGCWERSSSPGRKEAWREEWRGHGEMCWICLLIQVNQERDNYPGRVFWCLWNI